MAYALGYIRAAMQVVERGCTIPDASGDVTLPIRRVQ
jgi:hypothetical protein